MKRTGLTREQIYYIEERGHLGEVARNGHGRRYTEPQIAKLERIAACRLLGLRLDEAAPIAGAELHVSPASLDRLRVIAMAKAEQIERDVQAWTYVVSVILSMIDQDPDGDAADVAHSGLRGSVHRS
ncbi:MAG: MerR family transcriptional regulator [Chloroflexota bacterium]|nr:MerR family transcriptional regulator [Chloroflexota bacterium]